MVTLARIVASTAMILAALMLVCITISGFFHRNEKISSFFLRISGYARTILFLGMPIWLIAFLFAIGK